MINNWLVVGYSVFPGPATFQAVENLKIFGGPVTSRLHQVCGVSSCGRRHTTGHDRPAEEFIDWLEGDLDCDVRGGSLPNIFAFRPGQFLSLLWAESQFGRKRLPVATLGGHQESWLDPLDLFMFDQSNAVRRAIGSRKTVAAMAGLSSAEIEKMPASFYRDAEGDARLVLSLCWRYNILTGGEGHGDPPAAIVRDPATGEDVVRTVKSKAGEKKTGDRDGDDRGSG